MEETRHPTHRRYWWWSGMLKGAVAGASPTGPWTDRRTGELKLGTKLMRSLRLL